MIKKGYHYSVSCDSPKCDKAYVVGTARHNFEARRQAKQKVIKEGWTMGEAGTAECAECRTKRERELLAKIKTAMNEVDVPEDNELVTK
jgi:hypothetical protein